MYKTLLIVLILIFILKFKDVNTYISNSIVDNICASILRKEELIKQKLEPNLFNKLTNFYYMVQMHKKNNYQFRNASVASEISAPNAIITPN